MPPSRQTSVSPSSNTLTATWHAGREYVVGNGSDLYTYGLSECNVIATWTSAGINTLMHVTGAGVPQCVNNLVSHINNTAGTIYVIAVSGPDNGEQWFVNTWYAEHIKRPVEARLSQANRDRVRWVGADSGLLKNTAPALRGTFALLANGRYGPSNAPPPPSRPASSSSGSSFGNKGPLASARPSQSPARGGSPARPSSSGSAGSGKKIAAAPLKKR